MKAIDHFHAVVIVGKVINLKKYSDGVRTINPYYELLWPTLYAVYANNGCLQVKK